MSSYESESGSNSDSYNEEDPKCPPPVQSKQKRNYMPRVTNTSKVVNGVLQTCFRCNMCLKEFSAKPNAYTHTRKCGKKVVGKVKCDWCNLEFSNRGNLATHAYHLHGDSSYKVPKQIVPIKKQVAKEMNKCAVCNRYFASQPLMRYHIRKTHFNLKGNIPYAELKKVNQVWFERVMNSDTIMEIKKTSVNSLVMRPLDKNTAIKVKEFNTNFIDLSDLYPITNNERTECVQCNKTYLKRDFKKHLDEIHMKLVKHYCNLCNRSFKRSYQFIKHRCDRVRKVKGVKHTNSLDLRISSVASLSVPEGSKHK